MNLTQQGKTNNNMWIKSAVLDVNPIVFRRKLPFFTPANQPVNHREITTKSPLNYHWIPWNQVLAGVARSGVGTIEGLHHGAHVVPVFLGGRSQGVFSRWFDLWESIGIHGILMGFWWDFHGTWWDFDGFSWDFIIRILARALDYVNSSKFGIWSLKKNTHSKLGFQQEEAGKFTNKWGQQIGWGLFFSEVCWGSVWDDFSSKRSQFQVWSNINHVDLKRFRMIQTIFLQARRWSWI